MIAWPSTSLRVCVVLTAVLAVACSTPSDAVPAPSGLEATPTPVSPDPSPTPSPPSLEEAGFAGLFLDPNDNSVLYVYLVNPSQAAAEAAAAKHFGLARMQHIREVRPLKARYTMKQLREYEKAVRDAVVAFSYPEVHMTSRQLWHWRFVVGVDCESSLDRVRLVLQKRLPPPVMETVVVEVRERPRYRPGGFECISTETIDPITGLSTPGFGGLYFEDNVVSVYLLEPSQEVAEELVIDQLGRKAFRSLRGVRAVKGTYTWAQLMEWYEAISGDIYQTQVSGVVDVDSRWNRLIVESDPEDDDATARQIKPILSRNGVPYEAVLLGAWGQPPRPLTPAPPDSSQPCQGRLGFCNCSVRPGPCRG